MQDEEQFEALVIQQDLDSSGVVPVGGFHQAHGTTECFSHEARHMALKSPASFDPLNLLSEISFLNGLANDESFETRFKCSHGSDLGTT